MRRLLPVVLGAMFVAGCAGPPVQAMSNARQAILAAEQAGAARYAPARLAAAERWLDDAEFALQSHNYDRAQSSAARAAQAAREASAAARAAGARAPVSAQAPASTSPPGGRPGSGAGEDRS